MPNGSACNSISLPSDHAGGRAAILDAMFYLHFGDPQAVLAEMYRVGEPGGVICIDDITTDADPAVTRVIDRMDALIDVSHHRRLAPAEITALFTGRGMREVRSAIHTSKRAVREYLGHALQTPANAAKLEELVQEVVRGGAITDVLYRRDGETYFVNRGMTIVGRKPA